MIATATRWTLDELVAGALTLIILVRIRIEVRVLAPTGVSTVPVGHHCVIGLGPGWRRVQSGDRRNEERPDFEDLPSPGTESVLGRETYGGIYIVIGHYLAPET